MMGNGPVIEVGLHQSAENQEASFRINLLTKLKYFFLNFSQPVFVRVFQQAQVSLFTERRRRDQSDAQRQCQI